jgi:hypothetical protein
MRALGVSYRQIGHEKGKGDVLRQLAKWDGEAVGVVDADPGKQNSNPRELEKYREKTRAHGLQRLVHHADRRKILIMIDPILEDWLLRRARSQDIPPSRYGLPEDAHSLHRSPRYDLKPGFRRFLQDLAESDDGMITLKEWLTA